MWIDPLTLSINLFNAIVMLNCYNTVELCTKSHKSIEEHMCYQDILISNIQNRNVKRGGSSTQISLHMTQVYAKFHHCTSINSSLPDTFVNIPSLD